MEEDERDKDNYDRPVEDKSMRETRKMMRDQWRMMRETRKITIDQ